MPTRKGRYQSDPQFAEKERQRKREYRAAGGERLGKGNYRETVRFMNYSINPLDRQERAYVLSKPISDGIIQRRVLFGSNPSDRYLKPGTEAYKKAQANGGYIRV